MESKKRAVSTEEAYEFLKNGRVAHIATVDEESYPALSKIELFEEKMKKITGKRSDGFTY